MNDDVNVAVGGGSEPLRAIDRRRGIPLHAILDIGMEARNIEGPEIADIIEGDRSQGTELDGGGIDPELDPVCAIARDDHQGGEDPLGGLGRHHGGPTGRGQSQGLRQEAGRCEQVPSVKQHPVAERPIRVHEPDPIQGGVLLGAYGVAVSS